MTSQHTSVRVLYLWSFLDQNASMDFNLVGLLSVEGDAASQLGQENKSLSTILRGRPSETRAVAPRIVWQTESNLYLDVAKLCLSLLHAWTLDADLDAVCLKKLKLLKPAVPLSFGVVSRQGNTSLNNSLEI